jgi:hypothetical protein
MVVACIPGRRFGARITVKADGWGNYWHPVCGKADDPVWYRPSKDAFKEPIQGERLRKYTTLNVVGGKWTQRTGLSRLGDKETWTGQVDNTKSLQPTKPDDSNQPEKLK